MVIKSKSLSVLLFGFEVCRLTVSDLRSVDFIVNRFFMKLFSTNVINTVKPCHTNSLTLICQASFIIEKRRKTFVAIAMITIAIS